MLSPDENPFMTAHKPVEDGFPFVVETDSLADSMGLRLPNRSLYLLQGKVGAVSYTHLTLPTMIRV